MCECVNQCDDRTRKSDGVGRIPHKFHSRATSTMPLVREQGSPAAFPLTDAFVKVNGLSLDAIRMAH